MHCANDRLQPERPEWLRSGPFLMLALALHAAILFYPLKIAVGKLDIPPVATVIVRFDEAARSQPAPVAPPPPAPAVHHPKPPARHAPVLAVPTPKANTARPASPPEKTPARPEPAPLPMPTPANTTAATPAPVAAAPAAAPVITAARYNAAYLNNPPPAYPMLSRRLGEEGRVLLKVRVSADGLPVAVDLEKSSTFPRLDRAAEESVRHWRFVPARQGDLPIMASLIVPIVFKLE